MGTGGRDFGVARKVALMVQGRGASLPRTGGLQLQMRVRRAVGALGKDGGGHGPSCVPGLGRCKVVTGAASLVQ